MVAKDIKYVGVNDRKIDLFEGQYVVPEGMAYNSYVVEDGKIAVFDTVDAAFGDEWLANIKAVLGEKTPDYLIVQHMEPDHSANITKFTAVYPESSKWETFVNAYLSFEPASYFQPVEVDATLIGENLRPDDTLVEIWYKATGTDNAYQVISQHTVVPYGIEIGMGADGMDDGDYGYTVWNSVYDGNLYDYQAHLSKINKTDASTWPVSVVYGAPSRYSPINNAATGVLQVKLVPNRYGIIFNENYVNEGINVVSYGTHTWSYETIIDYVPVRDGYVFDGWYFNDRKWDFANDIVLEDVYLEARFINVKSKQFTITLVSEGLENNYQYDFKFNYTEENIISNIKLIIEEVDGFINLGGIKQWLLQIQSQIC